jgi:hypothetical protein
MLQAMGRGSTRVVGPRAWFIAVLGVMALAISGVAAGAASAETTWLCKPGIANNPCESSLTSTVELANGSSFTENAADNKNAPIDCFYVYPTVSSQFSENANLDIDPEETQIAIDQASRFSQTCKVYAPIYPQLTIPAINTPGGITPEGSAKAYIGAATAFGEYIEKYNKGRGFILIGHSQGAAILIHLIQEQFDTNTVQAAALRKLMVGAILLGGNVNVPKGKTVGATFKNVPACQVAGQTHCVIAYSSFLKEPPNPSNFGRVGSPLLAGVPPTEEEIKNNEVLCTNPSVLIGNSAGPMFRYESTTPFPGLLAPFAPGAKGSTPWVADPGQYTGQCDRAGGATWLQLTPTSSSDTREPITEPLGPLWGTHLEDVDVALGNLVANSALQGLNYQLFH